MATNAVELADYASQRAPRHRHLRQDHHRRSVSITNTGGVHILSGNKTTGSVTIKNNT